MGQLTTCPPASQPADVTVSSCVFDVGQIQKIILIRKFSSGSTLNFETVADAALLETWTDRLTTTDSTKAQVTPTLHNPTFEPGGAIEYGSGNEVAGGIPLAMGQEPTAVTFNLLRIPAVTKEDLVAWEGEEMAMIFIDEHGRLIGLCDDNASPTNFYPVPVYSYNIGDRKIGGKVEPDVNVMSFKLNPRWDNKLVAITPSDFNALIGLSGS